MLYATLPFTLTALASSAPPYPGGSVTPPELSYLWRQTRGPAKAVLVNPKRAKVEVIVPREGRYSFECAVTDGLITNRVERSVAVEPYFSAEASYTAPCPGDTVGASVTRSAQATSTTSAADAHARALAAAIRAATSALRCDPPLAGTSGWRISTPALPPNSNLRLVLARLVSGSAAKPKAIETLAALEYGPGDLPANLIDLSPYLSGLTGPQSFYLWLRVRLSPAGASQLPAAALRLEASSGKLTLSRVRFRDLETPYTVYQGYAPAYCVSLSEATSAAIAMSLDLSKGWESLGLATHGWDNRVYGASANYDRLVFAVLAGTPEAPQRQTVLGVLSPPAYNLADPYDFSVNRVSFDPLFYGSATREVSYVLRRARVRADGSLVYDPNETGLRFEAGANALDYSSPSLSASGSKIGPLAANEAGSITSGNNIALSFEHGVPAAPALVSFPLARWSLSSFRWKLLSDPYTYVLAVVIQGTPANPMGIGNRYALVPGDPEVFDGPENIFLPFTEFATGGGASRFDPFTVVFYAATIEADNYTLYPNSFPILANPRLVHGEATYSVNDFAGYGSYPASEKGAVTFSGVYAYAETLYHARVNNGVPFPL